MRESRLRFSYEGTEDGPWETEKLHLVKVSLTIEWSAEAIIRGLYWAVLISLSYSQMNNQGISAMKERRVTKSIVEGVRHEVRTTITALHHH
jgi:hypothetical protein